MKIEIKNQTQVQENTEPKTSESKRKKKYNKPSVVYQAPLEAMAGVCAGLKLVTGQGDSCNNQNFS